jgi:hypothetical protein
VSFADDSHFIYRDPEIVYYHSPGRDLILSEPYRIAQLPLVEPAHPDVIRSDPASGYDDMGTYAAGRISLVGFVSFQWFADSPVFHEVMNRLALTAAGAKVAWPMIETRRYRHHFTVCGRLNVSLADDEVVPFVRSRLTGIRRFRAQIRGPWFSQDKNGRGYFPVYPELDDRGVDCLSAVQRALGVRGPRGFFIGCLQLRDHLRHSARFGVHEADDWFAVIEAYRDQVICEIGVDELAVIKTHDDLVLSARALDRIRLCD